MRPPLPPLERPKKDVLRHVSTDHHQISIIITPVLSPTYLTRSCWNRRYWKIQNFSIRPRLSAFILDPWAENLLGASVSFPYDTYHAGLRRSHIVLIFRAYFHRQYCPDRRGSQSWFHPLALKESRICGEWSRLKAGRTSSLSVTTSPSLLFYLHGRFPASSARDLAVVDSCKNPR